MYETIMTATIGIGVIATQTDLARCLIQMDIWWWIRIGGPS